MDEGVCNPAKHYDSNTKTAMQSVEVVPGKILPSMVYCNTTRRTIRDLGKELTLETLSSRII